MVQNGKTLSMHNEAIWKGTFDDNGMLLKIHENAYTIGYSALLSPDGNSAGKTYLQYLTQYLSSLVSWFVNQLLLQAILQSTMK